MTPRLIRSLLAIVVGSIAAIAVVVSLSGRGDSTASAEQAGADSSAVRADFLQRWEAWRRATLKFSETTERSAGGQHLTSTVEIAQRFPDRIVRDGAQVSARLGTRRIGCSMETATDPAECTDNGSYVPEKELALELQQFSDLTSGSTATYRLTRLDEQCFRFRHVVDEFRPQWGDRMDVCFGGGTGAVVKETTVNGSVSTTVERRNISDEVSAADFELPARPVPSVAAAG